MFVNQLFDYNFNSEFIDNINFINTNFFTNQIQSITNTLTLIKNNSINIEFNDNIKKQTVLAFKWCKHYRVSINYNSKYLIRYKKYLYG